MSCFSYIIWQEFCLDSCQRFESILCNTTSSPRHKMQQLTLSPVTSSWAWVSETLELRSSEWQCQAFCLANKRTLRKLLCCCASKWWPKSFNLNALRGQAGQWHGGHPVPAALCFLILSEWMFIQHLCMQGAPGMGMVRWSSCLQRFQGGEVGQTQHSKINTELGARRAAVRTAWGLEAQGKLLGENSTQIQSQTRKMKSQGGRCRSMAEVLEARGRFLLKCWKLFLGFKGPMGEGGAGEQEQSLAAPSCRFWIFSWGQGSTRKGSHVISWTGVGWRIWTAAGTIQAQSPCWSGTHSCSLQEESNNLQVITCWPCI